MRVVIGTPKGQMEVLDPDAFVKEIPKDVAETLISFTLATIAAETCPLLTGGSGDVEGLEAGLRMLRQVT